MNMLFFIQVNHILDWIPIVFPLTVHPPTLSTFAYPPTLHAVHSTHLTGYCPVTCPSLKSPFSGGECSQYKKPVKRFVIIEPTISWCFCCCVPWLVGRSACSIVRWQTAWRDDDIDQCESPFSHYRTYRHVANHFAHPKHSSFASRVYPSHALDDQVMVMARRL